jgi:penicillin-binding protein 1A
MQEAVLPIWQTFKKSFSFRLKTIKCAFINISTDETDRILKRAMKSSNRWNVLTSLDKTEEEIIKSFGVKQNDGLYLER